MQTCNCSRCVVHMQALGVTAPASFEEIGRAYKDLAKVWHPDRFENDPRLRQKAEETFKAVQQAFNALKEHRGKTVHAAERQEFHLSLDYSLRLFRPILDGKRAVHASSMTLPNLMVAGEQFKRRHQDIRLLVAGYLFTDTEIVGRGWLNKIQVKLSSLPSWNFSLKVQSIPDVFDRLAAKMVGDSESLVLEGTCEGNPDTLSFGMLDRQTIKLEEILHELTQEISRT